jgi:hypothetical protein
MGEAVPPDGVILPPQGTPVLEPKPQGLDVSKYHQWRDFLFKLQVGEVTLPNESESSTLGHSGRCIGQDTVLHLSEDAQSVTSKHNGIATEDQVPDQQVMVEASKEDRTKFFTEAFLNQSQRRWIENDAEKAKSYVVAGITMGSGIVGETPENIQKLLVQQVTGSELRDELKQGLLKALSDVPYDRVKNLTEYLIFSQTQMTQVEEYALRNKFKPQPQLGSEPIEIGGETYEFEGTNMTGGNSIAISEKDRQELLPLFGAVKRGRADMVEQARETAYQLLGAERGSLEGRTPPSWWIERENLERLKSNQVLVFFPYGEKNLSHAPQMFQSVANNPLFRSGWNILTIDREAGFIAESLHLNS